MIDRVEEIRRIHKARGFSLPEIGPAMADLLAAYDAARRDALTAKAEAEAAKEVCAMHLRSAKGWQSECVAQAQQIERLREALLAFIHWLDNAPRDGVVLSIAERMARAALAPAPGQEDSGHPRHKSAIDRGWQPGDPV